MRIREAELQAAEVVQRAEQEARRVRRLQRAQRGAPLLLERVEAGDRLRRAGAAAVTAAAAARAFEAQSLAPQRLPMPMPTSSRAFEEVSVGQRGRSVRRARASRGWSSSVRSLLKMRMTIGCRARHCRR